MPGWTTCLSGWCAGTFLMWRIPTLPPGATPPSRRTVSVIIPARDEGNRLGTLLSSLQVQSRRPDEVIVVDDQSVDETALLASRMGARVVRALPPPPGWLGKPWACWQGALQARGELLLFLDADTWLSPRGLESLLGAACRHGGLVSVQPFHVTSRPHEQLSAFFNVVVMACVNAFTPLGHHLRPRGAFGPCLVCAREDYFAFGGHAAVKGEIIEDVALAKRCATTGLPVTCYGGRDSVLFRMYPQGVRELAQGWTKGLAAGAMAVHPVFVLLAVLWITGCFQAFLEPLWAAVHPRPEPAWPLVVCYLCYAGQLAWMLRRVGRFWPWTWLLYPVPLTFFALLTAHSLAARFLMRRVTWKGRTVAWPGARG